LCLLGTIYIYSTTGDRDSLEILQCNYYVLNVSIVHFNHNKIENNATYKTQRFGTLLQNKYMYNDTGFMSTDKLIIDFVLLLSI